MPTTRSARSDDLDGKRRERAGRPNRGPRVGSAGRLGAIGLLAVGSIVASAAWSSPSFAAAGVSLGTAGPFAVLAGTAVTNVPTSSITGDVGLSPAAGSNYAGITTSQVTGTIYSTNVSGPAGDVVNPSLLTGAKNDLVTAFGQAAGKTPTATFVAGDNQLGGKTLVAGTYAFGHASTANLTAAQPLVLNGQGNVNATFVFQASSDLVTASNSLVELENGAQACNVFWVVGSSATLSSSSTFVGTLMALTSTTVNSGATIQGRLLARNGAVTLDSDTIVAPTSCASPPTTTTTASTTSTTPGGGGSGGSGAGGMGGGGLGATGNGAVIPLGAPATGLGGTVAAGPSVALLGIGALLILGSVAVASSVVVRRRRSRTVMMDDEALG